MSYIVNTSAPVLVTGATGYVAGWLVKRLLEAGATVHAPIRNPDDAGKRRHLDEIAAASPGTIRYFKADLLDPGSYDEAMAGCAVVFHTASPFTSDFKDPQKELVDPALEGTRNVLDSANRTETVGRVVLTSSCAAIYCDAVDCAQAPNGRLDESVWNETASLDYQPYSYSKTVAEREAWKMAEAQARWRLVAVNPSLVIGPALQDKTTSESFNILRQMGDGTMKQGAPKIGIGVVDVRDLADAHMAAGFVPDARGRHIVSAHETDFYALSQELQPKFGDSHPLPRRPMPKWLFWLVGPVVGGVSRKFVTRNADIAWRADNAKSKRELGVSYRPLRVSMEEMFASMIESGQIKA